MMIEGFEVTFDKDFNLERQRMVYRASWREDGRPMELAGYEPINAGMVGLHIRSRRGDHSPVALDAMLKRARSGGR